MIKNSGKETGKRLYLLAELDRDSQEKIKELEKTVGGNGLAGKQTKGIPYHITLSAFLPEKENFLKDLLDDINKRYSEINVTFSGIGLFGLDVLFINPNMNRKLIELYDAVKGQGVNKDDDLAAHVTLLIDEPENILKALPGIAEKFHGMEGKITCVSLYEFFPARLIKRAELKK